MNDQKFRRYRWEAFRRAVYDPGTRFKRYYVTILRFLGLSKPLLISYPRSARNWVKYCIQFLSKRPGSYHTASLFRPNFVFDQTHRAGLTGPLSGYRKCIIIIRNYKECLIRHNPDVFQNSASVQQFLTSNGRQPPSWYILNIQDFDRFSGEKLLIYYEDLIKDTGAEILKLLRFLEIPETHYADFVENLEFHRQAAVKNYKGKSYTRGDPTKTTFHSDVLSDVQKREFDRYYQDYYPDLVEKYLTRYREP